ncbi:hypothetical protein PR202_ga25114 [Eleusine coracana subsp. coracana]|uniref:Glycosyltransferase n=1 Tax=Eleusine coracana subsp. coracana TaxID=191504 RepID=A0AAV5DAK1_ELECO|nr:hypothetical protein QOZ80_9AG0670920 [Eleusine coracana subsp. coracana]GJN07294.1 hypothetical protein PR202_ga25114 [Eleusine coracana subsp. coracana]
MASVRQRKKLHIVLFPFFATSHIRPFTDLAFNLTGARPGSIEATIAVTPANASIAQSAIALHNPSSHANAVKVGTYEFPDVEGLAPEVQNMSAVKPTDAWRIESVACDELLMRPRHESLIRDLSADVVITDLHFFWNAGVAADLGIPCLSFNVLGVFPALAMERILSICPLDATSSVVTVPEFPVPDIRVPLTELPEFLRSQHIYSSAIGDKIRMALKRCHGIVFNSFTDLEGEYHKTYSNSGYVKRAYFLGPLSQPLAPPEANTNNGQCIDWLDTKEPQSVVYLCFGSLTHLPDAQLRELALGLEASMVSFLWVVRDENWVAPEGWKERVGDRGMVVKGWAPQTRILEHQAVGAFVSQCGWNSVQEAIAFSVPVLTWPMVFEQFLTERLLTEVLGIGRRLWPDGAGVRSTRYEENDLIPAEALANGIEKFMLPGGAGEEARKKIKELSVKARSAVVKGGSSHQDLQFLIDDLLEAREVAIEKA